jgi:aldehyde dehydrogenase (NAD+)
MAEQIRGVMLVEDILISSASGPDIEVFSPVTQGLVGIAPSAGPAEADRAVAAARRIDERAEHLHRVIDRLTPRIASAVDIQIIEMGGLRKHLEPSTRAIGSHSFVDREAALAATALAHAIRDTVSGPVYVFHEPIGVSLHIVAWNGPVAGALAKVVPALLAGCAVILKTSPNSPLSARYLAEAFHEAGLPSGLISILHGGAAVGRYLVSHGGVDHVSFTGSTVVGREIGRICGEQLKPVTLELGGKSAALVLDDANLAEAIPHIMRTSLPNSGQICWATTRIVIAEQHYDDAIDLLRGSFAELVVGDPDLTETDIGPVVSEAQLSRIESYIDSGTADGAALLHGGRRPEGFSRGWFVEPTLFGDVSNSMRIAREEIFGPVVAVIRARSDDEAVAIANDSPYGLGGAVHSGDVDRAIRVARRLQTGTCSINSATPGVGGGPFGGLKSSGVGRERSLEGYASFTEVRALGITPGMMGSLDRADPRRDRENA